MTNDFKDTSRSRSVRSLRLSYTFNEGAVQGMDIRAARWLGAIVLGSMLVSCSSEGIDTADGNGEEAAIEASNNTNAVEPDPAEAQQQQETETNAVQEAESDAVQEENSNAVQEPQVDHQAAQSPDGRYRIETFGVNDAITAAGLYPAAEIRLIDLSNDEVKWSTHGYYRQSFLWSPDSRYAAVYAESRTHGETFLVDVDAMDAIQLPNMEAVTPYWEGDVMTENEYFRHDPYFRHVSWLDNDRIRIAFEWNGSGDDRYSGTYVFGAGKRELLEVKWE
jgi:hypothetical protein